MSVIRISQHKDKLREMIRLARAAVFALFLGLALRTPAHAIYSGSLSFSNSRSSIDSGGARKMSASYRADASHGAVGSPALAAASYAIRDGYLAIAYQPGRVTDLWASSTALTTTLHLQWTAPGNDGDEATSAGAFIVKYSTTASFSPAASNANFEAAQVVGVATPTPGPRGTLTTVTVAGLMPGVTYYFAIKSAERDGIRSTLSLGATALTNGTAAPPPSALLPQAPFGLALASVGVSVSLSWLSVARYENGAPFANANAAAAAELNGYRVLRSTSLLQGTWAVQAVLSSSTLQWTDVAGGPQYFYTVVAQNAAGLSARSVLRSAGSLSAFVIAPDGRSYLEIEIPSRLLVEGTGGAPMTAYLFQAASHAEDIGGRVVKSVEFTARQGGTALVANFELPRMSRLKLRYEVGVSSVIGAAANVPATPDNLGVYWYNGSRWVQMYGVLDQTDQTLNLQTKYLGLYQLRVVERSVSFVFDSAGVSNRFVTPNGDGRNDTVVFHYDNPRDSSVKARILDIRGRVLVSDLPAGPVANSRVWDGKSAGSSVPGGIYLYHLEAEGRAFSGTIVVLK